MTHKIPDNQEATKLAAREYKMFLFLKKHIVVDGNRKSMCARW